MPERQKAEEECLVQAVGRNYECTTRTLQIDRPSLVNVQKRVLRGLGETYRTGARMTCGSAGTVESCFAAETGKYIALVCKVY
jgi:hypothetical protein